MRDCNSVAIPIETNSLLCEEGNNQLVDKTLFWQMLGSLRYACSSRSDIAFGVGLVSKFMESPQQVHLNAVKRLLRYLKGTNGYGIVFPSRLDDNSCGLIAYSDADCCGYKTDRRSTTRYSFQLGNAHVSWCSKKQNMVVLSSCDV
ncbi:unnamed protein product [Lupinus luteus]|uniref:Uncharacterized protein n=1 Tax=Lupinus luteus TaxID=3873 RepID=A0AAV1WFE8_LUPLU